MKRWVVGIVALACMVLAACGTSTARAYIEERQSLGLKRAEVVIESDTAYCNAPNGGFRLSVTEYGSHAEAIAAKEKESAAADKILTDGQAKGVLTDEQLAITADAQAELSVNGDLLIRDAT